MKYQYDSWTVLIRHTSFNVIVYTRRIVSIQMMPIHGDSEPMISLDPFLISEGVSAEK